MEILKISNISNVCPYKQHPFKSKSFKTKRLFFLASERPRTVLSVFSNCIHLSVSDQKIAIKRVLTVSFGNNETSD